MAKESLGLAEGARSAEEIAIEGFDHVEFYVGNALQACYYYNKGFGFDVVAYRGLETGERGITSYVLRQKNIQLVLTSALAPESEIARHVSRHGDGVKSIGLRVKDARLSWQTALSRGAASVAAPSVHEDEDGVFVSAAVSTYGDTVHTFIERHNYRGSFPGYRAVDKKGSGQHGLLVIDHIVGNVETGNMDVWAEFYRKVFGFHVLQYFDAGDISTQYSALISKVMANRNHTIKMPINEPASGSRRSQIQEYLDYYNASGVQHIAVTTGDIIKTVESLRASGIDFLTVPPSYYQALPARVGKIDEDIDVLSRLGILVDREAGGYLLQIFTKPVEDRPTLFFEIIQRKGAQGFGKGNFQALFESIEREQALRGNL